MNSIGNVFIVSKKLELIHNKCNVIYVSGTHKRCPLVKVQQSMLLNAMLYKSEDWQELDAKDMTVF